MPEPTRTAEINLLKTALSLVGQSEEIPQESLPTLPGLRSLVSAYNDKSPPGWARGSARQTPLPFSLETPATC